MSEEQSQLKLFSLGIVVETKPKGTDYILVSPVEVLNIQQDGKIKDYKKDFKGNKEDLESTSFKTEHESKNYLRAKWIPFGHSNRITAPDVVVNETVILFKYSQVDEYYWTTIFREPDLRRLETVLYAYSDLSSGISKKAFSKDSSYFVEVSTKDKYIHIHTSASDGEAYEYDITIDTKQGFMNFKDNRLNFIEINSKRDAITLRANRVINLDAPQVNIRSSNGIAAYNERGVYTEGDRIEHDTTVDGRQEMMNNMIRNIDSDTSIGTREITRIIGPEGLSLKRSAEGVSRGLDDKLKDIGIYNYSIQEINEISKLVFTTTTDIFTEAKTEEREVNK